MEYVPGVPKLSEAYAYSILKANDLEFDGSTLDRMKTFLDQNRMLAESRAAEKLPYESIASYGFNPDNASEVEVARQFNRLKGTEAQLLRPYAIFHAINIQVRRKNEITWEGLRPCVREYSGACASTPEVDDGPRDSDEDAKGSPAGTGKRNSPTRTD